MADEIEIMCPECGTDITIEADDFDDLIICEECSYEFYADESVADNFFKKRLD